MYHKIVREFKIFRSWSVSDDVAAAILVFSNNVISLVVEIAVCQLSLAQKFPFS